MSNQALSFYTLLDILPIDAKYKLYDELKVGNEDIYQCFLYAFAYKQPQSRGLPKALLLYPGTKSVPLEQIVEIRSVNGDTLGQVYALGISIPSLLQEMIEDEYGTVTVMIVDRIKQALNQI